MTTTLKIVDIERHPDFVKFVYADQDGNRYADKLAVLGGHKARRQVVTPADAGPSWDAVMKVLGVERREMILPRLQQIYEDHQAAIKEATDRAAFAEGRVRALEKLREEAKKVKAPAGRDVVLDRVREYARSLQQRAADLKRTGAFVDAAGVADIADRLTGIAGPGRARG